MSEVEAKKAIEAYFTAWNARDSEELQKTMHYPHMRIDRQGRMNIINDASESKKYHEIAFERLTEGEGWDHSTLDLVEVIHKSDVKVHFKIEFSRYRADGTKYATHKSLWIATKEDDQWRIRARSSYA